MPTRRSTKNAPLLVNQVGAGLGFDQGTVNAAIQIGNVRDFIKSMSQAMLDVPTPKMVDDSTKLQKSFEALKQALEGVGNQITDDLSGPLTQFDNWVTKEIHDNPTLAKEIGEVALAYSAAFGSMATIALLRMGVIKLGFTGLGTVLEGVLGLISRVSLAAPLLLLTGPAGGEDPAFSKEKNDEFLRNYHATHPNALPGQSPGNSTSAIDYFIAQGWTPAQAAGIAGNLQQESGFNPLAGAGTAHQGIAQWDIERQRDIERHFNKPLLSMTTQEQLAAIQWELTAGKYKGVGDKLRTATSPAGAAYLIDHGYEMPGNYDIEDQRRQYNAQKALADHAIAHAGPRVPPAVSLPLPSWSTLPVPPIPPIVRPSGAGPVSSDNSSVVNINGPINITSTAPTLRGTANDLRKGLADALVTQSNRGLV